MDAERFKSASSFIDLVPVCAALLVVLTSTVHGQNVKFDPQPRNALRIINQEAKPVYATVTLRDASTKATVATNVYALLPHQNQIVSDPRYGDARWTEAFGVQWAGVAHFEIMVARKSKETATIYSPNKLSFKAAPGSAFRMKGAARSEQSAFNEMKLDDLAEVDVIPLRPADAQDYILVSFDDRGPRAPTSPPSVSTPVVTVPAKPAPATVAPVYQVPPSGTGGRAVDPPARLRTSLGFGMPSAGTLLLLALILFFIVIVAIRQIRGRKRASARELRPLKEGMEDNADVEGTVRSFRERSESINRANKHALALQTTVWTFVVDRVDPNGNPMPPIPVEMRGLSFEGVVNEGDKVRIAARWKPGMTLNPKRLVNLTTQAAVNALNPQGCLGKVALIAICSGVLLARAFLH